MKKTLIKFIPLLFIALFFKSLLWSLLVPLWHTPDEQAHFGHVAFIAEGGDLKRHGKYPDMTEEIYTSLDILGTKRDQQGNNKFTFHPEYRLPYSNTFNGPQEEAIKNLPSETRKNFIIRESAYYPHLYYQISSSVYNLFSSSNLFIRVFVVRLFWIMSHLLLIWLVFKTSKLIFPKNPLTVITITTLTAFQPMLSFVSSGVTSDNLHNLLFTAIIYFSLKILKHPRWPDFIGMSLVLGLGIINKQQFSIAFLIIAPVIIYSLIKHRKTTLKYLAFLPLFLLVSFIFDPNRTKGLIKIFSKGVLPYLYLKTKSKQVMPDHSLLNHLTWTIKHTIKEVIPWYWGVFNWLGVVFPITIIRLLNRLILFSGIGLIIKTIKTIKTKKITSQDKMLIFIAWSDLIYFLALTFWDWTFMKNNGFSFGIQGRYHFPVIISHLILLTVGIKQLFSLINKKVAQFSLLVLSVGFIIFNLFGLFTVSKSYYNVANFQAFILQASQYKPWFAKGNWLITILFLFIISLVLLIYQIVKRFNEK